MILVSQLVRSDGEFYIFIQSLKTQLSLEEQEYQFQCFLKLQKNGIPYIYNDSHFADIIGITLDQLIFFQNNREKAYCTFKLRKSNGQFRIIDAPNAKMKQIQRWILDNILYKMGFGKHAHGFIPRKSIRTNSEIHIGQDLVMGIDIKNFFPSIKFHRVFGLFQKAGFNDEISKLLAEICTYKGQLPQGAPTSPAISNIIAWHIDIKLAAFCKKRGLKYSRYADDITISGGKQLPRYKKQLFKIIRNEGFEINLNKVRIQGRGTCQKVTGVVVNDSLSIGKEKKRFLRSIVHNIVSKGPIAANITDNPFFKEWIYGLLNYANMIEPKFAQILMEKLQKVSWDDYYKYIQSGAENELCLRTLQKASKSKIIHFTDLKCFSNIDTITQEIKQVSSFKKHLGSLVEKCEFHTIERCSNCLDDKNDEYQKCMKYILGHYIGTTGGHHHGQEIYDIGELLDYCDRKVFVAFLLKSKRDTNSSNSLFRQFFECAKVDEIEVLSIATPHDIDHKLMLDLRHVMGDWRIKKCYCIIGKKEIERILYDYQVKFLH